MKKIGTFFKWILTGTLIGFIIISFIFLGLCIDGNLNEKNYDFYSKVMSTESDVLNNFQLYSGSYSGNKEFLDFPIYIEKGFTGYKLNIFLGKVSRGLKKIQKRTNITGAKILLSNSNVYIGGSSIGGLSLGKNIIIFCNISNYPFFEEIIYHEIGHYFQDSILTIQEYNTFVKNWEKHPDQFGFFDPPNPNLSEDFAILFSKFMLGKKRDYKNISFLFNKYIKGDY